MSWSESNESEGIPLGIWSVRMLVKRNIDSWVTIDGEQALVVYKGQLQSCRHCKEQAHTGISCVQNKKLLYQKSYANVAKQTGQTNRQTAGHQSKNSASMRPTNMKTVGTKSTAPSLNSFTAFPNLPKSATKQSEPAVPKTLGENQPTVGLVASHQTMQQTYDASLPSVSQPKAVGNLGDIFKKPFPTLRSQSKSSNGNETDDSTTSTNSRRTRGGPAGKKPRPNDGDDEQEENYQL